MRIAYISYEYPPDTAFGGIATYLQIAAKIMSSRGHEIEIFAGSLNREGAFSESGIIINRVKEENRIRFAESVLPIFSERHHKKPFDVIEGPEFCADARCISDAFPDIPYVLRMHTPSKMSAALNSSGLKWYQIKKRFFGQEKKSGDSFFSNLVNQSKRKLKQQLYIYHQEKIEKKEAKKADIAASPSLDLCDFVERKWNIDPGKIIHSPHPFIPDSRFLSLPVERKNDNDTINIGFIGRVQRRKGVSELIRAVPEVVRSYKNVSFTFVGNVMKEPSSGKSYNEWAEEILGADFTKVHFTGAVPYEQIPDYLSKMDIVVLPSIWENFPNTCLEAMSAGRAIIGSKNGGMAEMLDGDAHGLLADPKNRQELVEKISFLIENPEKRTELGKKARKRVLDAYNGGVIGSQNEKLFLAAIQSKQQISDA